MSAGALVFPALAGLGVSAALALVTWAASVFRHDVSIVDRIWSVLILSAGFVYAAMLPTTGPRTEWLLAILALWAARLAVYVTWRNWGEGEDRRYQAIRKRNNPGFATKSLYLVFGFQALLAWIVSWPLLAALGSARPPGWLDALGAAVFALGLAFETIADAQLARFKGRPENAGGVLDTGLWRYTRHPNYFGEFCVWWGLYLIALSAGGWWTIASPLLMSLLLLRVSGVTLLEKDIGERRPAYRDYVASTNAFFPGVPHPGARQRRARP